MRVLAPVGGGGGKSGKHKKDDGGDVSLETPEVLAMSSPIYAQDITKELLQQVPNLDVDKLWVRVQDKNSNVMGPGIEELDGKVAPQQKPGTAPSSVPAPQR